MDKIANFLGTLGTIALTTVIVTSPHTANIARAIGNAVEGGLRASMGR